MNTNLVHLFLSFIPVLYWLLLDFFRGVAWTWQRPVSLWLVTLAIVGLHRILSGRAFGHRSGLSPIASWGLLGMAALSGLGAWAWESSAMAWVFLAVFYAFLLSAGKVFGNAFPAWGWIVGRLLLLAGSGLVPVGLEQIGSRFAEEEFFVFLEVLALAGYWAALALVVSLWRPRPVAAAKPAPVRPAIALLVVWLALLAVFGYGTVKLYAQSFYDPDPPGFPGISAAAPFRCGRVSPDSGRYAGRQVFRGLLERVEANPAKSPADYGLLALVQKDPASKQAFRDSLLREARQARFTAPAHSVKFGQYEAALRLYYYFQVDRMDPGLFSPAEKSGLTAWFQAVNRRAQTREWVDYFYGLAFSAPLKGPYENQEIGSGLLALLEYAGLGDPDLRSANREYLKQRRGWNLRFRNTDDAYIYQTEWLHNAFFQQLYQGTADERNLRLSLEWLLLQALPDGAAPDYNMPARTPLAETAYLGALLLRDPRYLWLAGRALDRCRSEGRPVSAAPGLETEVDLVGIPPTEGTCLLYGNSGLPTQNGPLAPDKIVFRDGWAKDSLYLLLNLRFSGWHRYKATNTVTLLYRERPLTGDRMESRDFDWLPAGRRVFRDKRIPRENLNGLVVERVGLSRVLFEMTRLGSLWAQDPPRTAVVEAFETAPEGDRSTTVIRNWHGWEQRRDIQFRPGGPVVVADRVSGPSGRRGALLWHLPAGATVLQNGSSAAGADTVLVKVAPAADPQGTAGKAGQRSFEKEVLVETRAGRLRLVTVFLTGAWVRAGVRLEGPPERLQVQVTDRDRSLTIPVGP